MLYFSCTTFRRQTCFIKVEVLFSVRLNLLLILSDVAYECLRSLGLDRFSCTRVRMSFDVVSYILNHSYSFLAMRVWRRESICPILPTPILNAGLVSNKNIWLTSLVVCYPFLLCLSDVLNSPTPDHSGSGRVR